MEHQFDEEGRILDPDQVAERKAAQRARAIAARPSLPQWQSHKKVWADQIIAVEQRPEYDLWVLAGHVEIEARTELQNRVPTGTDPVGGYYVQYEDGFESWSPEDAFEGGYTLIEVEDSSTDSSTGAEGRG